MRNMVTNNAMRPGTMSIGITNPIKDMIVSRPVGRYVLVKKGLGFLLRVIVKPDIDVSPIKSSSLLYGRASKNKSKVSVLNLPAEST